MSKNRLIVFWLNEGKDHATVHINKFSTGSVDIQINGISKETLKILAKDLGLEIKEHNKVRWIQFARARDKSQVTVFEA